MITAQTGSGNMQISHTELQRIRLLIWYPEKDTVPEKEIERITGEIEWEPPLVLLVTSEKEWQQHEKLDIVSSHR